VQAEAYRWVLLLLSPLACSCPRHRPYAKVTEHPPRTGQHIAKHARNLLFGAPGKFTAGHKECDDIFFNNNSLTEHQLNNNITLIQLHSLISNNRHKRTDTDTVNDRARDTKTYFTAP
jgi:hypothetical protein